MPSHHRRASKDLTRRRDRTVRGLEASGSIAVVGCLAATGLLAGALGTVNATASAGDTPVTVLEPSPDSRPGKPTPRPTKTVITYKTILVTPSPKPPAAGQGGTSGGWSSSGSTSGGSGWTPTKAATPVRSATKAPTKPAPPPPQPKPSATSAGS